MLFLGKCCVKKTHFNTFYKCTYMISKQTNKQMNKQTNTTKKEATGNHIKNKYCTF